MIEILTTRRSVSAKELQTPGPNPAQLELILKAAHRVPDHGKLGPWRYVVFEGEARQDFGQAIARIFAEDNPDALPKSIEMQQNTFNRAPLVIAVISTAESHIKIPEWEQIMSAGASCQNILLAAHSLGFAANWLTEWYAYHPKVCDLLQMASHHRVAGFIYIGSHQGIIEDRVRPPLDERVRYWKA